MIDLEGPLGMPEDDSEEIIGEIVDEVSRIIEYLRRGKSGKGATTREIAHEMDTSQAQVRAYLREIHERGMLRTGRKRSIAIDGKNVSVPTYWIASEGKADAEEE